jgi:hypothetical protein
LRTDYPVEDAFLAPRSLGHQARRKGGKCLRISDTHFQVQTDGGSSFCITTDQEAAKEDEQISLLGLEHPYVRGLLDQDRQLEGAARALVATQVENSTGVLTVWHVSIQDSDQRFVQKVIPIGLDDQGKRSKAIELLMSSFENLLPASVSMLAAATRTELVSKVIPDMLRRDLTHQGLLSDSVTLDWRLLAWIELN